MLTAEKKRQIVNSYSKVLIDILTSSSDCVNDFNECKTAFALLSDKCDLNINPLETREYKHSLTEIEDKINITSEIQKFLFTILKRRYGFLLKEIIDNVENDMQDKLNRKKVVVLSQNELSNHLKSVIEKEIIRQVSNVVIEYKINKGIAKDSIDFLSNGNISSVNLKELMKKYLI